MTVREQTNRGPRGVSRTGTVVGNVASGEIERVLTTVGRWDLNRVHTIAPLAPWEERTRSQHEIVRELRDAASVRNRARSRPAE